MATYPSAAADLRLARKCIMRGCTAYRHGLAKASRTARPSIARAASFRHAQTTVRLASTAQSPSAVTLPPANGLPSSVAGSFDYPPRILIYHAGTGRIVFLGCTKIATIILVAFACLAIAPTVYAAEEVKIPLPWMNSDRSRGDAAESASDKPPLSAGTPNPVKDLSSPSTLSKDVFAVEDEPVTEPASSKTFWNSILFIGNIFWKNDRSSKTALPKDSSVSEPLALEPPLSSSDSTDPLTPNSSNLPDPSPPPSSSTITDNFGTINIAPTTPTGRLMLCAAVILGSYIPLHFVLLTTRSFVAYIHLSLPPAARRSRATLHSWAANIPANTRVTLTTLRTLGTARQIPTVMAELTPGVTITSSAEIDDFQPKSATSVTSAARELSAIRRKSELRGENQVEEGSSATASASSKSFSPALASRKVERVHGRRITFYGDVPIYMTRKRIPGWQPPDASARNWWEFKEQSKFVVVAGRNKALEQRRPGENKRGTGDQVVWEGFLAGLGRT